MPSQHGTNSRYVSGCRCAECRRAHTVYNIAATRARRERLKADPSLATHGKASTYTNWMCRCEACTAAEAAAWHRRPKRPRRKVMEAPKEGHGGQAMTMRFVGTRPDGMEVLVTIWDDEHAEYAERPAPAIYGSPLRVWGPPVKMERAAGERRGPQ